MSYILDALKRADAERERGVVPGLHAQPGATLSDEAGAPRVKPLWWAAGGAGVVVLALLGWRFWTGDEPVPEAPPRNAAPSQEASPAAQSSTAPVPSPAPAPAPPAPLAQNRGPGPSTRTAPLSLPPMPAPQPAPSPAPAPASRRAESVPPVTTPAPPVAPSNGEAASAGAARLYSRAELPEPVRRALPNFAIGGSIYSATPADRLLIVNGQLFHEQDTLAPDLVLEQIRPKSAVLVFKGYRVELPY